MITIDLTMPIQIINILILIVILNAVLYRPVRSILELRARKLAELESGIETFKRNADLRAKEFDAKVTDARRKAQAELEGVRQTAQKAMNDKVAEIRRESDTAKAEQLTTIRSEMAAARKELQAQVDGFAAAMAEKILGRAL
ncbi:MAG: ATP synthase F0 subunit B [Thermodesulfobacteriota bacterium]